MINNSLTPSISPQSYVSNNQSAPTEANGKQALIEKLEAIQDPTQEELDEIISQGLHYKTLEFQVQCQRIDNLTLQQAKNEIEKLTEGKIVKFLSTINILFVEVMKVVEQLGNDQKILNFVGAVGLNDGKDLIEEDVQGSVALHQLAVELHLLFRKFHEYSSIFKGKTAPKDDRVKLMDAQNIYIRVYNYLLNIEGIVKKKNTSTKLYSTLKLYVKVLCHICHNEDMLKKMSVSTSDIEKVENSILAYPPSLANMNLYLDSIKVFQFSLSHCRTKIKNDYTIPLEKAIEEINKLSGSSAIQGLGYLTSTINEFISFLSRMENGIPKKMQDTISGTNVLTSLTACFQSLENTSSFLSTIVQMTPFVKEVGISLNAYRTEQKKLYDHFKEDKKIVFQRLNKAISSIKKTMGNKSNQLNEILLEIKKIACSETLTETFDALIDQSFRVPMCTFQEIDIFFDIMEPFNEKALTFQKSQLPFLPISSFNHLDLLMLQIFQCVDPEGKEDPFQNTIRKIITNEISLLLNRIQVIQSNSTINKITETEKDKFREDLIPILSSIVDILKKAFSEKLSEDMGKRSYSLKRTISALDNYLNDLPKVHIFFKHFASTFLDLCSTQHDISEMDLPLIQKYVHLLVFQSDAANIEETIVSLENLMEKRAALVAPQAKFFWNLNHKYMTLAKFGIRKTVQIFKVCHEKLQASPSKEDCLRVLHEYKRKMDSLENDYNAWTFQINMMNAIASGKEDNELIDLLSAVTAWDSCINYYRESLDDIVSSNKMPKKTSKPRIRSVSDFLDAETSNSDSSDLVETTPFTPQQETYQESPYEGMLSLLNTLKAQNAPILNSEEQFESYFFRNKKRDELIQNSYFYLALIEEAKLWEEDVQKLFQKRMQVDQMLLLEATEKLVLCHTTIKPEDFQQLIYTHNGEELVSRVNKTWFAHQDIVVSIQHQESLLKKAYWFKEDIQIVGGIKEIVSCSHKVWMDLADENSGKQNPFASQVKKFQECLFRIHKLKSASYANFSLLSSSSKEADVLISNIDNLKKNLQAQCSDIALEHSLAIERALDLYQLLSAYEHKDQMPLFFTMRLAEIQVNLLSSALILALSTINVNDHPLLKDEHDRPLSYCHRVDRLWPILKDHVKNTMSSEDIKILDTHIPLFIGDPRYPLSKPHPLVNDLVKMVEKVYLLQKIDHGGWFKAEDEKLLIKYLGKNYKLFTLQDWKEILTKKVLKGILEVEKKTLLALQLTEVILTHS